MSPINHVIFRGNLDHYLELVREHSHINDEDARLKAIANDIAGLKLVVNNFIAEIENGEPDALG